MIERSLHSLLLTQKGGAEGAGLRKERGCGNWGQPSREPELFLLRLRDSFWQMKRGEMRFKVTF